MAAGGIIVVTIAALAYSRLSEPPEFHSGTGTEGWSYRGVAFEVAYFSDWYNGTGWRFRFVHGIPNFASGSTNWAGVFASKSQAIASAQLTIDG